MAIPKNHLIHISFWEFDKEKNLLQFIGNLQKYMKKSSLVNGNSRDVNSVDELKDVLVFFNSKTKNIFQKNFGFKMVKCNRIRW